jgi:hypothetical protein
MLHDSQIMRDGRSVLITRASWDGKAVSLLIGPMPTRQIAVASAFLTISLACTPLYIYHGTLVGH